jgi:hypothetical protein
MPISTRRRKRRTAQAQNPRAKVFWTGRSQAVRLPKAFRVATREVAVSREGSTLVLEPVETARDAKGWPRAFWALAGAAPGFDLGERSAAHERKDALRRLR